MLPQTNLGEKTRRAVLKAAGAALGLATVGTAAGHPGNIVGGNSKFYGGTSGYFGTNVADASEKVDLVGYHSAGGVGPASMSGRPEDVHTGAMTELRVHDDLAFVSMFSAGGEHAQRGLAIFDISDFTRARSEADLSGADLTLLSFVRNDNPLAAGMDVKVSDDGEYVFCCKQAVTALFGEIRASEPNLNNHGTSAGVGSLVAIDVSDPGNPEVTDEVVASHWSVGPHNCWYHQIGGKEYVFTVSQTEGALGGVNTFRFDRTTGQLVQVNHWDFTDNLATGEYGLEGNLWYTHDITIQEDPKTGIPLAYLHYWDAGLRIFDVSDPLDVREVGAFEMDGCHYAVPAPTLVDGKRVAVAGHENPDDTFHNYIEESPGETGRYHLIDCDPLDAALDPDSDVEKVYLGCASTLRNADGIEPGTRAPYEMYATDEDADGSRIDDGTTELDSWVLIDGPAGEGWEDAPGFEEEAELAAADPDGDGEDNPGTYDGFSDFRLSTHNVDMDADGRLYAGHYHAGARFFEIATPDVDLPPGFENRPDHAPLPPAFDDPDEWAIEEIGFFREGQEIPQDRAMAFDDPTGSGVLDGLTAATPFFWTTVQRNGVVFASGINAGPHVLHHEDVPVGTDVPLDVDVEREHDIPVTFSGQALRITVSVDSDEDVVVRDAVPPEWTILTGASPAVQSVEEIEGYRTMVTLEVTDGEAVYLVEAPNDPGSYTFGPVEYARADADGEPIVDSPYGGGNSTTNRLWRKANAAVETVFTTPVGL